MDSRQNRPDERNSVTRKGALVFGLGIGAVLAVIAVVAIFATPNLSTKLEYLPLYARTYYRKLFPPPQYLPTPAPTVSAAKPTTQKVTPTLTATPPALADEIPAGEALPAAAFVESEVESTPPVTVTGSTFSDTLPTPTVAAVDLTPIADTTQLNGLAHQWQTWNNCGPATVTMHMSYFGRSETQVDAAKFLKPNKDDKNVSPYELAAYARSVGMEAIVRQGGTVEQLKQFLSNDLPVLAETWLVHDGDGLGHYRLVTGYNDEADQFSTYDSLNGPNYKVSYDQFDSDWRVFNRLYIVIYPPDQADTVSAIIGNDIDDQMLYERLVETARAEGEAEPGDAIAYFNLGDALTRLGRYEEAVEAFDRARQIGLHWRRLWYQFTPFEAYFAVGRYQDVLDLAKATLASTGGLEEPYYYQGLALQVTDQPGAEAAFQAALAYNPNFELAREALEAFQQENN